MVSILLGLVLLLGGLSGKLVLRGSHGAEIMALFGVLCVLWGVLKIMVIKPND
jgi:hypothetical protein